MLIRIELDRADALLLAYGLGLLRAYCAEHSYLFRPALAELARLAELAKHGLLPEERTFPDNGRDDGDAGSDAPRFLTRRDFAALVGRNERTIRRWVARGDLAATVAGIPASELNRLKGERLDG